MSIKLFFKYAFILVGIAYLSSCGPDIESRLSGQWIAYLLIEEQDTLSLPVNDVKLEFYDNRTYYYDGTLKYREEGTFRTAGRVIYTTDTLKSASEKAVHIEQLKNDTLILNMRENNKQRRLFMHRNRQL